MDCTGTQCDLFMMLFCRVVVFVNEPDLAAAVAAAADDF